MDQLLIQTAWLIPLYALAGALLSVIWFPSITRRTGPRPSGYLNTLMTLVALVHSLLILPSVWQQPQFFDYPWLEVAGLRLALPLEVSTVTVSALVLINGLNLLAQVFAMGYLELDWGWARFFSVMALFEAGMSALVLCDSLFFSYMVLEILTLGTYLLIGFWFNQSLVVTGARDAFLTKRVGDLFLLMGVVALLPLAGTWNFHELATWAAGARVDPTVITLVGLALLAGPLGKCAQFPLHLWLDEAMEGPIPASILRNSVVVTTGTWVLVKMAPVLALSPVVQTATVAVGAATALGATLIAIAQIDAKRVLSYSVSAFMGLTLVAVGTGHPQTALLIVLTYALGMALLVMAVGAVIWNSITQDVTKLGGLWSRRPVSGLAFVVGALGLVALPPLGGFWSLGELVQSLWSSDPLVAALVVLVNGLTAFSLTRAFSLIFLGHPQQMTERSPEVHWPMAVPMLVGLGLVLHLPLVLQAAGWLPATLSLTPALALTGATGIGIAAGAWVFARPGAALPVRLGAVQAFFAYDLYSVKLYRLTVVAVVGIISRVVDWLDRNLVDALVNALGLFSIISGQGLRYTTNGRLGFYVLTIMGGLILLGLYLTWPLSGSLWAMAPWSPVPA